LKLEYKFKKIYKFLKPFLTKILNYRKMSRILLPKFERFRAVTKETQKWTDKNSLYYKLPEHYKKRHRDFLSTVPQPVHYKKAEKIYEVDHETGFR